jgi:hypothetical protein
MYISLSVSLIEVSSPSYKPPKNSQPKNKKKMENQNRADVKSRIDSRRSRAESTVDWSKFPRQSRSVSRHSHSSRNAPPPSEGTSTLVEPSVTGPKEPVLGVSSVPPNQPAISVRVKQILERQAIHGKGPEEEETSTPMNQKDHYVIVHLHSETANCSTFCVWAWTLSF